MNRTSTNKLIISAALVLITLPMLAQKAAPKQPAGPKQAASPLNNVPKSTDRLAVKARFYGDSVVLRWSPGNPLFWQKANRAGYRISRFEVNEQTQKLTAVRLLTPAPLKPWTTDEWKQRCTRTDSLAGVAVQILYGKATPEPGSEMGMAMDGQMDAANRFLIANMVSSWSAKHAKGLALRFTDTDIKANRSYVYAISMAPTGNAAAGDTTYLMVRTNKVEPQPDMPEIKYQPGDRIATFRWDRRTGSQLFTGYHYERSDDGGRTYKRLNRKPYVNIAARADSLQNEVILLDSLPRNYTKYLYRIVGITPFSDLGTYSPAMPVSGIDLTPPTSPAQLVGSNVPGSNTVKLTWRKNKTEPDFIGFVVGRGTTSAGPFTPLSSKVLPKETREFTDPAATEFGTNFYVVSAIDTAGNASLSVPAYVPMRDRGAPNTPTGLAGKIDTTGRVVLTWTRNAEPDLLGYMVYVANARDHAFTPLTPDFLADEFFTDTITLRTLTEKIYYRLVAFDKSKRASGYSEILEVKKPDRIAPVSPVFNNFLVADSSVTLRWVRSSSDDVAEQWLYRKEEGKDADYQLFTKFSQEKFDFVDRTVLPRRGYQYALMAVDDSQNKSPLSFPMRVRTYDAGVRKGTQNLTVTAPPDKPIQLRWNAAATTTGRVLVYRRIDDQPLRLIDNVPASQQTYLDASLQKGTYQYALKTVYADGGESPLGTFVRVER